MWCVQVHYFVFGIFWQSYTTDFDRLICYSLVLAYLVQNQQRENSRLINLGSIFILDKIIKSLMLKQIWSRWPVLTSVA